MAILSAGDRRHSTRLAALERKMMAFYASATDYFASPEAGADNRFYEGLRKLIDRHLPGPLKVLEVGAGKSAFPTWLRRLPREVCVSVQDVTPINMAHLCHVADEVFIGPLDSQPIDGRFDLVVSSFVYEHVVYPQRFLDRCLAALRPGGLLVIFSPKYTLPF
jgi:2-polyprenyl-3-methyl-5-hydroxy-6-metoxy-1,4-benzoquinol methylase